MAEVDLTRDRILTLLAEAPERVAAASAGVDAAYLRTASADGEWSATEILAHMRACADVWGSCIATILAEDRPTIRAVNPRTWILSTDYLDIDFRPSFQAFSTQRLDLIATLLAAAPEAWLRSSVVTGAGTVLERDAHSYAHRLASHEQSHVKQIERIGRAKV